jgi:hypothetical protein
MRRRPWSSGSEVICSVPAPSPSADMRGKNFAGSSQRHPSALHTAEASRPFTKAHIHFTRLRFTRRRKEEWGFRVAAEAEGTSMHTWHRHGRLRRAPSRGVSPLAPPSVRRPFPPHACGTSRRRTGRAAARSCPHTRRSRDAAAPCAVCEDCRTPPQAHAYAYAPVPALAGLVRRAAQGQLARPPAQPTDRPGPAAHAPDPQRRLAGATPSALYWLPSSLLACCVRCPLHPLLLLLLLLGDSQLFGVDRLVQLLLPGAPWHDRCECEAPLLHAHSSVHACDGVLGHAGVVGCPDCRLTLSRNTSRSLSSRRFRSRAFSSRATCSRACSCTVGSPTDRPTDPMWHQNLLIVRPLAGVTS